MALSSYKYVIPEGLVLSHRNHPHRELQQNSLKMQKGCNWIRTMYCHIKRTEQKQSKTGSKLDKIHNSQDLLMKSRLMDELRFQAVDDNLHLITCVLQQNI